jgi:Ser/Thr protein kinase RdoA (MazF antagonist)
MADPAPTRHLAKNRFGRDFSVRRKMFLPRLTPANVLDFLQGHHRLLKDVPPASISVVEMTRRNVNLAVSVDGRPALFVKQVQYPTREVVESQQREARCYQIVQETPWLYRLRELMPRCVLFDAEHSILVLECLDGVSAGEAHARVGAFDARVAEMVGECLARLYETRGMALQSALRQILPGELPWALQAARDRNPSSQRSEFLSYVETDEALAQALSDLRASWRRDAFIHGDARPENFFFCRPRDANEEFHTRIVDWELSDAGDAAWDCAGVMQYYWQEWIAWTPPSAESWDALRRAIDHFWSAYVAGRGDRPEDVGAAFHYTTRMTGARLIQTAYEHFARSGEWTLMVDRCARAARQLLTDTDAALEGFRSQRHVS